VLLLPLLLWCWLLLLLAAVAVVPVVEWCGTAVRMKMGEMGSTESVGCGERQISSPASRIQIRIHPHPAIRVLTPPLACDGIFELLRRPEIDSE
jgi:hypothetical protein